MIFPLSFRLLGSGGRTAMAGQVYYAEDFKNAERAFPDYYDGKLFIYEWMRGWIMAVTMDKEGNYVSMERFMPSYKFSNPMDMEFGSETVILYMLEYGTGWFRATMMQDWFASNTMATTGSQLIQIAADKPKGAVPMTVNFNSNGTKDYDRDPLTYEWKITGHDGQDDLDIEGSNCQSYL